ncbi:AAEL003200-PB [Aedes aegypti]|uniref:AAEL003200-PA n=1 Tax=Aedes aegypti TaxID=7159 RepID=Q17G51_AEDAE|nr:AAEL003200-PA [Aedes aegypti]EAT45534.1 AAEL003200-PB [Aedes aegypti]
MHWQPSIRLVRIFGMDHRKNRVILCFILFSSYFGLIEPHIDSNKHPEMVCNPKVVFKDECGNICVCNPRSVALCDDKVMKRCGK